MSPNRTETYTNERRTCRVEADGGCASPSCFACSDVEYSTSLFVNQFETLQDISTSFRCVLSAFHWNCLRYGFADGCRVARVHEVLVQVKISKDRVQEEIELL